jgi:hypothetical protein
LPVPGLGRGGQQKHKRDDAGDAQHFSSPWLLGNFTDGDLDRVALGEIHTGFQ